MGNGPAVRWLHPRKLGAAAPPSGGLITSSTVNNISPRSQTGGPLGHVSERRSPRRSWDSCARVAALRLIRSGALRFSHQMWCRRMGHVNTRSAVIDFLFPPRCPICMCRNDRVQFCERCRRLIDSPLAPLCLRCGEIFAGDGPDHLCSRCVRRPPHFDCARACARYAQASHNPLTIALHRFKYGRDISLAPLLGHLLVDRFPLAFAHDVIVPVPLDIARLRWRGFNQSVLLARYIGNHFDRPVALWELKRCRTTTVQVGLTEPQRRMNVRGAFSIANAGAVRGKRVLLVDDVMTTGATADECAGVLYRAGARLVDVVVVARASDCDAQQDPTCRIT